MQLAGEDISELCPSVKSATTPKSYDVYMVNEVTKCVVTVTISLFALVYNGSPESFQ